MRKVILVHANCINTTALGDFVFAGNLAKDLKMELNAKEIDVFLVSSLDGMSAYQRMYGNPKDGRIQIEGVSIGLSSLEQFDAVRHTVVAFIDANRCKYSSSAIIKRVIDPDTKFLFIGNANQTAWSDLSIKSLFLNKIEYEQPGLYQLFDSKDILIESAGFGAERFGLPIISKSVSCATLTAEQTALVPSTPYGFMYLSPGGTVSNYQIISQYMNLTNFDDYVLVGDFSKEKKNINSFYQLDAAFSSGSFQLNAVVPTIHYYDSLYYPVMRRMVANSTGDLVVSTGITSTLEAMRDDKLSFYQDSTVNEYFVASYLMAVQSTVTSDALLVGTMPQLLIELSTLLFAAKPLNSLQLQRTKDLLAMSPVRSQLIAVNETILDKASGTIAPRVLSFISSARSTQDQLQLTKVCLSLRKAGELSSPVYDQALRRASSWGRLFELKVLIKAMQKQDLNKVESNYGFGALHFAVKYKQLDCARALVHAEVDLNLQAKDGRTSLHLAVGNKDREMIKLLVESGAAVDIADKKRKKPEESTSDNEVQLFIRNCCEAAKPNNPCTLS